MSVVMESRKEPPIFLGPIFIHDNSDFESFSNFFNHLRVKLINTNTDRLVFGTDEELALVNAITTAFPESGHILCTRHIRQNVKQKLTDDCIDKVDRNSFLEDIFEDNGLIHADDVICYEAKWEEIEEKSKGISAKFHRYCVNKLKNTMLQVWEEHALPGNLNNNWTNNNCESLNHVLKRSVDWKSKPLLDLVTILKDIADVQYKDMLRSLVAMGQYRVADSHKHFQLSKTAWISKTSDERDRLFKRFKAYQPPDKGTVTSTDGNINVIKPRSLGKKIGQRKRKINERTTTFKRTRTQDLESDSD